jgi:hypothetical protein
MNANQNTRGFVIHLVTRDGAHRGWWRHEFPHIVELDRAKCFATAYEALTMIPTPALAHTLVGEVWSLALALAQERPAPAFAPGGVRI